MAKRIFDLLLALFGLLIFGIPLLLIALLIKLEDGGPVFYRGRRVGLHGTPFYIFKFRSMVVDAEKIGASSTSDCDARITRTGRILRKLKLDELPQLFNVLAGDMSFVGPRPEVQKFVDMYTDEEKLILTLRPGITDWASLWNADEGKVLAGSSDPDGDYLRLIRPQKLKYQLKYARERTLWVDICIIASTAWLALEKLLPPCLHREARCAAENAGKVTRSENQQETTI